MAANWCRRFWLKVIHRVAWAGAIAAGLLVLVGWWLRIEPMKQVLPGMPSMNPVTAVCFILGGGSLGLQIRGTRGPGRNMARLLASLVLVVGLMRLGCYLSGRDFPVDQWFFTDQLRVNGSTNQMAPGTALCFWLLGMALVFLDWTTRRNFRPAEVLAVLVGLVGLLAVVGYIYRAAWLYGGPAKLPMALPTAVTFVVFAFGILFSRPDLGMMAVVTGESSGGWLLRRMFPAMGLVFIVAGALRLAGERRGYFDAELGVALYTVTSIGIMGIVVMWSARSLHRADRDRRRVEEAIIQLNAGLLKQTARLEGVNQELESFSYSVSHDLRAPLRGISGFAQALEEYAADTLDIKGKGYQRVRDAAERMGGLIDDLLKLSRLTRAEMKLETVNLSAVAASLVEDFRTAEPGRQVRIVISPDILVRGDSALLRVVLDNLIGNAWKFTSKNPLAQIEVGTRPATNGRTSCFVRDNGVGFDERYAHKLFGAFQRLHSQVEFPGTGIGLATVQRIVGRHGGEVRAEGEINHGATFGFALEAVPEAEPS